MGCVCSKQRPQIFEDPSLLSSQTIFTAKEIIKLNELFRKLGSTLVDDGFINRDEFKLGLFQDSKQQSVVADRVIPLSDYLQSSLLNADHSTFFGQIKVVIIFPSLFSQLFDMFDSKHDGVIDFGEFIRTLSIFHPDTPQQEKAVFAFNLYDIWQTGYIEKEEVKTIIVELLNESNLILSDDIIEAIIDKTFDDVDREKDGKIDIEEWKEFAERKPSLLRNMTIPYLKDLSAYPSFEMRSER